MQGSDAVIIKKPDVELIELIPLKNATIAMLDYVHTDDEAHRNMQEVTCAPPCMRQTCIGLMGPVLKYHARSDVGLGTSRVTSNKYCVQNTQPNHFKIHIRPRLSGVTACPQRLFCSDLGIAGGCH